MSARQQSHLGQGGIPGHIRHVSEDARGHSPNAVEGIAQGGGGQLAVGSTGQIISNRGGEVSHLWIRGGKIIDPFTAGINQLSGWTEVGTVPRLAAAVPPGCSGNWQAEAIGPLGLSQYLALGSGPDALDFTGDFSACVVFLYDGNAGELLFDGNFGANGAGYRCSATVLFDTFTAGSTLNRISVGTPVLAVNAVCFGRAGTTQYAQLNAGGTLSLGGAFLVPGLANSAKIGNGIDGGNSASIAAIYEVWVSTLTPTPALFSSLLTEVHGRLGVTAW